MDIFVVAGVYAHVGIAVVKEDKIPWPELVSGYGLAYGQHVPGRAGQAYAELLVDPGHESAAIESRLRGVAAVAVRISHLGEGCLENIIDMLLGGALSNLRVLRFSGVVTG
jgi:hypothetical protein